MDNVFSYTLRHIQKGLLSSDKASPNLPTFASVCVSLQAFSNNPLFRLSIKTNYKNPPPLLLIII